MRSAPVPGSAFPRAAFLTEKVVGPETLSRPRGALGNVPHEGAGAPRAWGCLPLCGSGGDTLRGRSVGPCADQGGRETMTSRNSRPEACVWRESPGGLAGQPRRTWDSCKVQGRPIVLWT